MGFFIRKHKDGRVQVSRRGDFTQPPPETHQFTHGWLERHRDVVIFDGETLEIIDNQGVQASYKITRQPGVYCNSCGEKIGQGPALATEAAMRRKYVESCEKYDSDLGWYEVAAYYLGELNG